MYTGRTIEELMELVQHINTNSASFPGTAPNLIDAGSTMSSPAARSSQERTEPAWLAVFL